MEKPDIKDLMESIENYEKDFKVIEQAFELFKGWPIWKIEAALDTIRFMAISEFVKKEKKECK